MRTKEDRRESRLRAEAEHAQLLASLEPLVGRTIVQVEHAMTSGYDPKDEHDYWWSDDEPLYLHLDDGTTLKVSASGWHDSGSLNIEIERDA